MAVKPRGGGGAVLVRDLDVAFGGVCAGGWLVRRVTSPGQVCGRPSPVTRLPGPGVDQDVQVCGRPSAASSRKLLGQGRRSKRCAAASLASAAGVRACRHFLPCLTCRGVVSKPTKREALGRFPGQTTRPDAPRFLCPRTVEPTVRRLPANVLPDLVMPARFVAWRTLTRDAVCLVVSSCASTLFLANLATKRHLGSRICPHELPRACRKRPCLFFLGHTS